MGVLICHDHPPLVLSCFYYYYYTATSNCFQILQCSSCPHIDSRIPFFWFFLRGKGGLSALLPAWRCLWGTLDEGAGQQTGVGVHGLLVTNWWCLILSISRILRNPSKGASEWVSKWVCEMGLLVCCKYRGLGFQCVRTEGEMLEVLLA